MLNGDIAPSARPSTNLTVLSVPESRVAAAALPRQVLTTRLGAEEYGIDILAVQEIRRFEPPTCTVIVGGDEVSYGRRPEGAKTWREKMLQEVGSQLDPKRTHFLGKVPYDASKRILQVSRHMFT